MEHLINTIKPFLEALSYLSGVVVAIAALFALRQIRLMKFDMIARSERSAKEKAIEVAFRFTKLHRLFEQRIPLFPEKVPGFYVGLIGDFTSDSIPHEWKSMAEARFSSMVMDYPLDVLDGIAATCLTGVADERTAFTIFGGAYCATVAGQYDLICMAMSSVSFSPFSNIVELYQIWSARLSRSDLEKARKNLEEQISRIPSKEIPPLSPMPKK
ncbi:MAG: hypothetical protein ACJ74G_00245 [Blastocatellia bacterium]